MMPSSEATSSALPGGEPSPADDSTAGIEAKGNPPGPQPGAPALEGVSVSGTDPGAGSEAEARAAAHLAALIDLAEQWQGQPDRLLRLLRQIEQLHRTIQDGPFRGSLPADRNTLFELLAEMERSGGWPYIPRLQLRTFLDLLQREDSAAEEPDQDTPALAA